MDDTANRFGGPTGFFGSDQGPSDLRKPHRPADEPIPSNSRSHGEHDENDMFESSGSCSQSTDSQEEEEQDHPDELLQGVPSDNEDAFDSRFAGTEDTIGSFSVLSLRILQTSLSCPTNSPTE